MSAGHVAGTRHDSGGADAVDEELDMVLQMYSDECERVDGCSSSSSSSVSSSFVRGLVVHLPHHLDVYITLPTHNGYPHTAYPDVRTCNRNTNSNSNSKHDARQRAFVEELRQRMHDELCLGYPTLLPLIALAHTLADEYDCQPNDNDDKDDDKDNNNAQEDVTVAGAAASAALSQRVKKDNAAVVECAANDDSNNNNDDNDDDDASAAIEVWAGEALCDRKSKFVAHMARVHSVDEVRQVIAHLRTQRHIAAAAHPTIYAYRFTDDKAIVHTDCDDDGEHGASSRLAFLLEQMHVDGYVVVVTRWFGGILLGPDRYKHIMDVARHMLLTIPQREGNGSSSGDATAASRTRGATASSSSSSSAKQMRRRR